MADTPTPAAEKSTPANVKVSVEYLVDYNEFKAGDKGKLPVSEAWSLSYRNVVRQTNVQK